MTTQDLAKSLTSGDLWPAIGAALVLVSWLLARVKEGVSFRDQLKHAGALLFKALPLGLSAGGAALAAGTEWTTALALAIGSVLMAAGLTAPKPPADEPKDLT